MAIWLTTPVDEVPQIQLRSWKVYEVSSDLWPEKTRHFVGWNITEGEGRVSSSIVEFDKDTMRGRTASGRVYELIGQSGYNSDAAYTWNRWCKINSIDTIEEVQVENA